MCSNGTVRLATHGKSQNDCSPCPAGFMCFEGDPVPVPCPEGYYCEYGANAVPCPRYRYNSVPASTSPDACFPCPAGFLCNSTAIFDFRQYPCPPGFFCSNSSVEAQACPAGTYRDTPGAARLEHCFTCPAGYYCPRETDVYFSCPKVSKL